MTSVRRDIQLAADPATVWDAVADVGAVHRRLCPGVLIDSRAAEGGRVVTFAGGAEVRERVVDLDPVARRFVYTVVAGTLAFEHHQASMQVEPDGAGSRLVWVSDLLPDELAPVVAGLMDRGVEAMRSVFTATPPAGRAAPAPTPAPRTAGPSPSPA
jgi:carbon monoxide dehydrogenase subunit G